ncbi:hypothetical protein LENED_006222 [Lentinula edodes]|uniref:Uncharacterized protein n=1 Tax=Lentinula edodes TaxID=5353 RepID=A0A1Q3EB15_LENED|nr:hypothetical protein LENED_006222 [Lentinula edodes]
MRDWSRKIPDANSPLLPHIQSLNIKTQPSAHSYPIVVWDMVPLTFPFVDQVSPVGKKQEKQYIYSLCSLGAIKASA